MLSFLALTLTVLLPLASTQTNVGTCSLTDISNFATQLPNGAACSTALGQVSFAGTITPPDLQSSLETLCHVDCGKSIAEFFIATCEESAAGGAIAVWCIPQDEDRYCRNSSPDLIDTELITNLSSCIGFNPASPSCPTGCESSLAAFVDEVGCCYNYLYNDTETLIYYADTDTVTDAQAYSLGNITNPALWAACNQDLMPLCPADGLFTGTPALSAGTCTLQAITDFAGEELSESCQQNLEVSGDESQAPEDDVLEVVCSAECGKALVDFQEDTCLDKANSSYIRALCYQSPDAALGSYCRQVVGPETEDAQFFVDVGVNCYSYDPLVGTCPDGCADALQELSSQLGCCYQTIYNDTRLLDLFFLNDYINFEGRAYFEFVGYQPVWDACQVPLVQECAGDPFNAGAVKFAASTVAVVFVSLLTALLY